jgi:Cu/Ag efflux protein CusF
MTHSGHSKGGRSRALAAGSACALAAALALSGCARSSQQAAATAAPAGPAVSAAAPLPSGTLREQLVTSTATVKALDLSTRMVTLERADGSTVTFRAGDEVRNLPQVQVGDEVKASYYESIAFAVHKPGEDLPEASVAESAARAEPGEKPGVAGARVTTVTATIVSIDQAAGTVTIEGPDGERTTVKARDPRNLERVAVGDLVEISLTEAIGIAVETPK